MSLDGLPDSTFKGQGWKYHFNTFTLRGKFNVSIPCMSHKICFYFYANTLGKEALSD